MYLLFELYAKVGAPYRSCSSFMESLYVKLQNKSHVNFFFCFCKLEVYAQNHVKAFFRFIAVAEPEVFKSLGNLIM